jgi:hypothetical protein
MTWIEFLEVVGKRWTKGDEDRIYLKLTAFVHLHTEFYNTGNVSSQYMNGTKVSNNKAKARMGYVRSGKFWWDVKKEKFRRYNGVPDDVFDCAIKSVRGKYQIQLDAIEAMKVENCGNCIHADCGVCSLYGGEVSDKYVCTSFEHNP